MAPSDTLEVARGAVAHGARLAQEAYNRQLFHVAEKAPNEWLTSLDLLVDQEVCNYLHAHIEDAVVISEEQVQGSAVLPWSYWILDPIDGTRNAMLGIPYFAISLSLVEHGAVQVGVTCNVATGETFHARRGAGLWRNGERVTSCARPMSLSAAVVSTGFPHDKLLRPRHIALVEWLVTHCSDIRRFASPTLDLCMLATGKFQGVVEMLRPWDFAAGVLFLDEQGLMHNVRTPIGPEHFDPRFYLIAGTPAVFPALDAAVAALSE